MSHTRLLIIAVVVEKRPVREVAGAYGVSKSWLYELLARYRREGETVFQPRSRRPRSNPNATAAEVLDLIVELREKLIATGLDAGPDTMVWHLPHHHEITVPRATVARHLTLTGLVIPQPNKRPKSSFIRFEAAMPNQCWQADLTHCRLTRPRRPPRRRCRDPVSLSFGDRRAKGPDRPGVDRCRSQQVIHHEAMGIGARPRPRVELHIIQEMSQYTDFLGQPVIMSLAISRSSTSARVATTHLAHNHPKVTLWAASLIAVSAAPDSLRNGSRSG